MKRKSHVLNGILVLILLLLLGWGGHSWLQPKFPSTVNGDEIVPAPRELEIPALSRQVYSNALVGDVTRLNLFRKQRKMLRAWHGQHLAAKRVAGGWDS